jgi:hypothetical protein
MRNDVQNDKPINICFVEGYGIVEYIFNRTLNPTINILDTQLELSGQYFFIKKVRFILNNMAEFGIIQTAIEMAV